MGSDLERTLRTLFAGDTAALECAHPAWAGGGAIERSIAYRVPAGPGRAADASRSSGSTATRSAARGASSESCSRS